MFVGTRAFARAAGRRRPYTTTAARPIAVALVLGGDPLIDLEGAFFPAWMLCLLIGIVGAVVLRLAFARIGLEPHLGPLPLIYTCLALLLAMSTWLLAFPV